MKKGLIGKLSHESFEHSFPSFASIQRSIDSAPPLDGVDNTSGAMDGDVHAYQHLISEPTSTVKRIPTNLPIFLTASRVASREEFFFSLLLRQQLAQAIPGWSILG